MIDDKSTKAGNMVAKLQTSLQTKAKAEPAFRFYALSEIDPDHYEATNVQPVAPAHNSATSHRNAGDFHGKVTLPFDVKYAGLTLPPGSYSLSVDSLGNGNVVTMIPDGKTVKVQAHVRSRSKSHGPYALVLERAGQQRKLAAIRLKEQALTLDLESEPSGSARADTELIVISCATCTSPGN